MKNYIRGNNMVFTNKPLTRTHKKRSQLRNRFLKSRCPVNRINYAKQRNYCVFLLRKTKKEYYATLNEQNVADNKKDWKTVKPLLSSKVNAITMIMDDIKMDKNLCSFFSNVVKILEILEFREINISVKWTTIQP